MIAIRRLMIAVLAGVLACALASAPAGAQTYPTEIWPSTAAVNALNGTTDDLTGLPYISIGASPSSTPPLIVQLDRRSARMNAILAYANQGRVVQTDDLRVGVFPLDYVINGARVSFAGATDQGDGSLTLGDDTYYVYLDNANALQIVTDATGWPADISQFAPLAEVEVASSAIAAITDRRSWASVVIPQTGGAATEGVDGVFFVLDQDNGGAEADSDLRFNRGSTAGDAALRWNSTGDLFELFSDISGGTTRGKLKLLTLESTQATGTAPLVVASTTKVANLNADAVDGVSWTAPAAANGLAYSTSTSAAAFTGAAAAADVLYADGSGVPTWGAIGSTSGVQAYDADLDAVAGVATAGLFARTGAGTAAARTLTAGANITITNGDGVSGNPTVAVSGITEFAVAVGTSAGALTSTSVGADNTVLVGRTGNNPVFRKLLNADIDPTAAIDGAKILAHSVPVEKLDQESNPNGAFPWIAEEGIGWRYLHDVEILAADGAAETWWSGGVITNQGATAKVTVELSTATEGRSHTIYVQDTDGVRVQAATGDTIRVAATVTAAGGYIESTTIGNTVTLVAINNTEWVAISTVGTAWTFGP